MVTVSLYGKCTDIRLTPENGEPSRCQLTVQLDRSVVSFLYHPYDVQLILPVEFAALFEIGRPISVTLDQTG